MSRKEEDFERLEHTKGELLEALIGLFIIATEDGAREVSIREADAIIQARAAIKAAKS